MLPVEPEEPQSWTGISNQATFLVVNNQPLCKNQLGGSHLFFEGLTSVHPSSFVILKSRVQGIQRERPIFCLLDFLGVGDRGSFLYHFLLEFKQSTFKSLSFSPARELDGISTLPLGTEEQGLRENA